MAEDDLAAVGQYRVQDLVVEAVAGERCAGGDRWEAGCVDELVQEVRRTGHGRNCVGGWFAIAAVLRSTV
jgi:hypothetical protein